APVEHHLIAAVGRPPQLGDRVIDVGQIVGVEQDALGVALRIPHAEAVHERLSHRPRLHPGAPSAQSPPPPPPRSTNPRSASSPSASSNAAKSRPMRASMG